MKTNSKKRTKGFLLTITISILLIALCTGLVTTILAHASSSGNNVLHTTAVKTELVILPPEDNEHNLKTIVYTGNAQLPEDAVSGQFAIATTTEIAQRVFNQTPVEHAFARYIPDTEVASSYWSVRVQTEQGEVWSNINAISGLDEWASYSDLIDSWDWFDTWDEELEKQLDAKDEAELAQIPMWEEGEEDPKQNKQLMASKKQAMLDFAASKADLPHAQKAIELVNSSNIGNSATATAAQIMLEGTQEGTFIYCIEVTLSDGKFLDVSLSQDSMELLGYTRLNADFAETIYS